jgi:hypothetical protein
MTGGATEFKRRAATADDRVNVGGVWSYSAASTYRFAWGGPGLQGAIDRARFSNWMNTCPCAAGIKPIEYAATPRLHPSEPVRGLQGAW